MTIDEDELFAALARVPGGLTASVHCGQNEGEVGRFADRVAQRVTRQAGRILFNGYPTGVAVTWARNTTAAPTRRPPSRTTLWDPDNRTLIAANVVGTWLTTTGVTRAEVTIGT